MPVKVPFTKMHGIGNDFIVVDGNRLSDDIDWPAVATRYCDRRFGIGADGIIVVTLGKSADAKMRIFNADGSEPEMCGNGIRCLAKFAVASGMVNDAAFDVETLGGIKAVTVKESDGDTWVTVDMGAPELAPAHIPVAIDSVAPVTDYPITVIDQSFAFTPVSMGNPHAVSFVDHLDGISLPNIGPEFEQHSLFPNGVNAEFVYVQSPTEITVKVWERGSGITLACGTGACACVVAGVLTQRLSREVTVNLPGGPLSIDWREADNHVIMSGPAETVFKGEITI